MVLLQPRRIADFSTSQRARNLFRKSLLVAEFIQQGFVQQILDILCVVKGGAGG